MQDTPPSVPDFTQWPSFPFEGDIRVKQLDDPVPVEPPRRGEADRECTACNAPDEAYIWVGERWRVRTMDRPTGLPMVLILESRSHLDLGDLPNLLAAELGVMTVRLERAIRSLDGVARVHVNRWGDGSAHLHMWFLARPYGRLQLRGTFLSLWDSILPPISEERWRENLAMVAAWLAEFGGRPLAEPPRIQWQAPSSLSSPSSESAAEEPEEEAASVIEAADEIPESDPAEAVETVGDTENGSTTDDDPSDDGRARAEEDAEDASGEDVPDPDDRGGRGRHDESASEDANTSAERATGEDDGTTPNAVGRPTASGPGSAG
ncbi:hypothetical protein O7602_29260 [Micromonospora sp. WMMD1128]|uniref:hypothetical protein n=1 Tax=Micromonospora sp. WMMD1128 TaxID=3015150 RepID=UPI00248C5500|nr:hypothetical protein [Micromonospora sp. WMMD1128]WBB73694.1 hypothetical protein O7602_29260 [Micromonospora sp. WMMD1128]